MERFIPVEPSGKPNAVIVNGVAGDVAGDETSATDPVAATPGSVLRVAIAGWILMAAGLIAVGSTLTYLPMLEGTRAWDARISEELTDSRSDMFESFAVFVSRLADAPSILLLALGITLVLALTRKWLAMAFVPIGLLIEFACFGAVNYAVQRPRPDVATVGSVPSTFSFPSGHVAATVVCWIGAALLLATFGRIREARVVAAIGALMVATVAWARVYLGMHYALDTAAGVVMGGGALVIAARALWPSAFDGASHTRSTAAAGADDVEPRQVREVVAELQPRATSPR
jgi:undecaprenyl-diphosphatase